MTLGQFLMNCHPILYRCIDLSRFSTEDLYHHYELLDAMPSHFESRDAGGRGDAYRIGQKANPLIRARGIRALFDLLKEHGKRFSPDQLLVDVLGGNGTFTHALRGLVPPGELPIIITSDASAAMIEDALAQGLLAIRQPAQSLLLADGMMDGAVFAYGTHHIAPVDRVTSAREAYRVLKPGGRVVVQDFEEGTPTARWYSELLDQYTRTGHKCTHFTRENMKEILEEAGFRDVRVLDVYDPFIVTDRSPEIAVQRMLRHVCSLFALELLPVDINRCDEAGWKIIAEILRPYGTFVSGPEKVGGVSQPTVRKEGDSYVAEFPRIALVGVGTK
jgi:ubiquinone/menaquinone biosynthesis C-methylase UbiE